MRTLDALIEPHVRNAAGLEADVRDVLRIAAYELGWSDGAPAPVVIDQAVHLAGTLTGDPRRRRARRGLVNAICRALAPTIGDQVAALDDRDWRSAALTHSVPDWIARELFASLGADDARGVLAAANEPAESIVRWNSLRGSRAEFESLLPDGAVQCDPPFGDAYRLAGAFALEDSQIWAEGRGMAQSRASMLPVIALDPRPGERVLDLCSAPGAKTTQIASRMGGDGQIVAVELHEARARALEQLAERVGATLHVVVGDAREVALEGPFDAVLLDPPCTGLGVLSARPDARWRRREETVADLAELQRSLLARALDLVAPAGRIVYSTCTLLEAENEAVVRAAAGTLDDLTPIAPEMADPALPGALRVVPHRHGTDGFFVARLRAAASG